MKIDLRLMKDSQIFIKENDIEATYDNEILEFKLGNINNRIIIKEKRQVFIREDTDYIFNLEFKPLITCYFFLKTTNTSLDIKVDYASIAINDNIIEIKYKIETDPQEINIQLKFKEKKINERNN